MAPPLGELARPQTVTERALSASLCSAPPPKGEALLRGRTTCPVEWCGAPGGFGTRPYEVRIGAAVVRQGPGNPAPARWNCSFLSLRGAKRRGNPHPLWGRSGTQKRGTDSHGSLRPPRNDKTGRWGDKPPAGQNHLSGGMVRRTGRVWNPPLRGPYWRGGRPARAGEPGPCPVERDCPSPENASFLISNS